MALAGSLQVTSRALGSRYELESYYRCGHPYVTGYFSCPRGVRSLVRVLGVRACVYLCSSKATMYYGVGSFISILPSGSQLSRALGLEGSPSRTRRTVSLVGVLSSFYGGIFVCGGELVVTSVRELHRFCLVGGPLWSLG